MVAVPNPTEYQIVEGSLAELNGVIEEKRLLGWQLLDGVRHSYTKIGNATSAGRLITDEVYLVTLVFDPAP